MDTYTEINNDNPFYAEEVSTEENDLLQQIWKLRLELGDYHLLLFKIKELAESSENGICILIKNLIK